MLSRRWVQQVAHMGEIRNTKILARKPKGNGSHGRHRWEDNIKMDIKETGFGDVDRIHLV
jgi:hypothetical protein